MKAFFKNLIFVCAFSFAVHSGAQVTTIKYFNPAPKGEIPIMAWASIPANELTDANFMALKEAGININFSFHRFKNLNNVKKLLKLCAKYNIKSIVTCPELKSNPDSAVKILKSCKGLAGYFLVDEPPASDFEKLAEWAEKNQESRFKAPYIFESLSIFR